MINFIKILVAIFFYSMCYILLNESVKGDSNDDFIFTFFFALFSFAAGILFTCDVAEQIIKKLKQ